MKGTTRQRVFFGPRDPGRSSTSRKENARTLSSFFLTILYSFSDKTEVKLKNENQTAPSSELAKARSGKEKDGRREAVYYFYGKVRNSPRIQKS